MASQPPPMSMSEPNAALVVSPLSLDIPMPAESDNGSTAQPTPTSTPTPPLAALPPAAPPPPAMPQIFITFLVISGRRRAMSFDPSLSIGRVKELLWLSWHSDWSDERPPAPNYLRILYLGKLLQDDVVLNTIHNPLTTLITMPPASPSTSPPPQPVMIMHLSIRPTPAPGEADDLKKKRKRIGRRSSAASGTTDEPDGGGEDSSCCAGCVIC